jgi:hypothetical protein
MQLSQQAKAELNVTRATATPLWKGLMTMLKYRTTHNYKDADFLGARIGDKVFFALLIGSLYFGVGDDGDPANLPNIAAMLFMWCSLPACAPSSLRHRSTLVN